MVDCLRNILRSVLVVFAPHDVYIGVREEVALMGDLNWVIREDATEVEEAGAFLGDDAKGVVHHHPPPPPPPPPPQPLIKPPHTKKQAPPPYVNNVWFLV